MNLLIVVVAPFPADFSREFRTVYDRPTPSWRVLYSQVWPVLFPHQSSPQEHGHPCIHVPQRVGKLVPDWRSYSVGGGNLDARYCFSL